MTELRPTIPRDPTSITATRRPRSTRIGFGVALIVLASLAAACDGDRTTITGTIGAPRPVNPGTTGSGTTSATRDSRLVGRSWSRVIFLQDNTGAVHSSRTTWHFGADGIATRSVVAANLSFGAADQVVTLARWRTQGGVLIVDYLPEGSGSARFEYSFQGTTLILGGLGFALQ
jgi:hypothetical protein